MTTPNETGIALNRGARRQLGKFGKRKAPLDASFDYFPHEDEDGNPTGVCTCVDPEGKPVQRKHVIRVHPRMTNLAILGFVDMADTIDDTDDISSMKAVRDFLHSAIHPDDWEDFWAISLFERQSLEDFMELQWQLLEACSDGDRPLPQPSDSSDGQNSTVPKSRDDSFSRVMGRLDGRPDLQQMVVTAQTEMGREVASIN